MLKKPGLKYRLLRYHLYYKATGFYAFVLRAFVRFLIIVAVVVAGIFVLQSTSFDINAYFRGLIERWNTSYVLLLFAVSETLLGLIPPDIFIVWGGHFPNPWFMVTALASISYGAGGVAFLAGMRLRRLSSLSKWVDKKFGEHMTFIRKWGGIIVIVAALFPIPYASLAVAAGIVGYPFKHFMLYGITRYVRFYLYGYTLFALVGQ